MEKAEFLIKHFNLKPHPEGGYYREIYRSDEIIKSLPERYNGNRSISTSIYFLLKGQQVSKLHKLKSDEIWHFYEGSSVKIYTLSDKGDLTEIILGRNISEGEVFQVIIKREHWFCAEAIDKNSFSFVGCTVAPGFNFDDFSLAEKEILLQKFPEHKFLIKHFT